MLILVIWHIDSATMSVLRSNNGFMSTCWGSLCILNLWQMNVFLTHICGLVECIIMELLWSALAARRMSRSLLHDFILVYNTVRRYLDFILDFYCSIRNWFWKLLCYFFLLLHLSYLLYPSDIVGFCWHVWSLILARRFAPIFERFSKLAEKFVIRIYALFSKVHVTSLFIPHII